MAPFESTDHGFISSSDDIEEGTTNQFFTQTRARESFSVGDGALTQKNFTTALNTKLAGIADNADVTPTWVPTSNPNYVTSAQPPLETPVIATPSGTGNLTLTSNAGYNTLLTYTPPAPYQGQHPTCRAHTDPGVSGPTAHVTHVYV